MVRGANYKKKYLPSNPKFSICCSEGKIKVPFLRDPPLLLHNLLDYNGDRRSKVFRENIKIVNAMFSFTLTGAKLHRTFNDGRGPYTFHLNGHNHHRIGCLFPTHDDGRPRFSQLYIYDTKNEVENKFYALHQHTMRSTPTMRLTPTMRSTSDKPFFDAWLKNSFIC